MKKLFKLLILLVIVITLGIVGLMLWLDPNDYKPQLTQLVKEKTGRELTLQATISWSFFPSLGLSTQDIRLEGGSPNQKERLNIQKASTTLAFLPLLTGKVSVKNLTLEGVKYQSKDIPSALLEKISFSDFVLSQSDARTYIDITMGKNHLTGNVQVSDYKTTPTVDADLRLALDKGTLDAKAQITAPNQFEGLMPVLAKRATFIWFSETFFRL